MIFLQIIGYVVTLGLYTRKVNKSAGVETHLKKIGRL